MMFGVLGTSMDNNFKRVNAFMVLSLLSVVLSVIVFSIFTPIKGNST